MKLKKPEMPINPKIKGIKADESMNENEKDTISYKKSLLKSTIKNIREKFDILGPKILKQSTSIRKKIYIDKRMVDEYDYLQDEDIEHIKRISS